MVPFSLEIIKAITPHFRNNSKKALENLYKLLFRCEYELQRLNSTQQDPQFKGILVPTPSILRMKSKSHFSLKNSSPAPSESDLSPDTDSITPSASQQKFPVGFVDEHFDAGEGYISSLVSISTSGSDATEKELSVEERKQYLNQWLLREQRVLFLIVNCHINLREYDLALQLLEKALKHYQMTVPQQIELKSLLGSLYTQVGMISKAETIFKEVETLSPQPDQDVRCRLNRALMKFVRGQYQQASDEYDYVLKNLDHNNSTAANNRAVCLLYLNSLVKSVESLEQFIRRDPIQNLEETVVYNLCTLYDLESDKSIVKKRVIRALVARFKGEDFNLSALKLA